MALSQIVVGAIAVPLIVLLSLAKVRKERMSERASESVSTVPPRTRPTSASEKVS